MGVDFITCENCGDNFCDCGPYFNCSNCDSYLCEDCGNSAIKKFGYDEEEHDPNGCPGCDPAIVHDSDMLAFLIAESGKTKEEIEAEILKQRKG